MQRPKQACYSQAAASRTLCDDAARSQGGVQFPTGGNGSNA